MRRLSLQRSVRELERAFVATPARRQIASRE
jgi:hypothetical protein